MRVLNESSCYGDGRKSRREGVWGERRREHIVGKIEWGV